MEPGRFVSYCFLYCGAVLLATHSLTYGLQVGLESLTQYSVALIILGTGAYRLSDPDRETLGPDEYGPLTHGMAALALFVTLIFLAQLLVF